ncbi:uncharacterized protein LOC143283893, partial [Babylonia areolata]|uniref:uncharacterized protein LOC143283893 n=1 Tax=Babylonia areolata TaxID=304850 RepID=UPI003FD50BA8
SISCNLTPGEEKALQELKDRRDIIIKPADKGGAVVVWRRDLYLQEARSQLSNTTFYGPIARDTTKADNALIRKTIKTAVDNSHLPFEAHHAIMKEPCQQSWATYRFGLCLPTALISAFLDSVFQPLVAALPTYMNDTNHTLNLLNDFSFPADCTERHVFTMDIVSLYTNIPHPEGMLAVKQFLPKSSLRLHFPTILRLTELVLTLNSFSFDQDHFQQQSGVTMGTKMGPSFACLFVGFI